MDFITLSTKDIDNIITKLIHKFEISTLTIYELFYTKSCKRYNDDCIASAFFQKMRKELMFENIKIDNVNLSANQLKIIKWLRLKQCTKNKCGKWIDILFKFSDCSRCNIIKQKKQNNKKIMSISKLIICDKTDICSICIDDMTEGDKIIKLRCNHCYHIHCIETLVLEYKKQKCPNCRFDFNKKIH
jgi:hypothetical protein